MKNRSGTFFLIFFIVVSLFWGCSYSEKEFYLVDVGGDHFQIPKEYVWNYSGVQGDRIIEPNLFALYPSLEGKNEKNAILFDQQGWGGGRKITFTIKSKANSKSTEDIILSLTSNKEHSYIREWDLKAFSAYTKKKEFLLGTLSENREHFIFCDRDGVVRYPSCNTRIELTDKSWLFVTFSKDLMSDWKVLCARTQEKVLSFKKD